MDNSMIQKMMKYTISGGNVKKAKAIVAEFIENVRRYEPEIQYDAYRIKETNSFVHFLCFPREQAERAHREAPYTGNFFNAIHPFCEEQPVFIDLEKIEGVLGGEYE